MRMIQVQNLQAQDIQTLDGNQLLFHGQLFQLGPKISKKLENAALEYCQICCNSGQACLLQEDDSHWIVWKHVKQTSQATVSKQLTQPELLPFGPQTLSPRFIERCQQKLVDCIGPIAELVLEQTLLELGGANIDPQQFIVALSQKIPSPALAARFQADCNKATDAEAMVSRLRSIKITSPEPQNTVIQSKVVHSPASI